MEGEIEEMLIMDNIIKVTTLGSFSMTCGKRSITLKEVKSNKLLLLIAYFMDHKDAVIDSRDLIEYIWAYEDIDKPANALKNLIYRLRTLLKRKLDIGDMIVTGKGTYSLNKNYVYDVDVNRLLYQVKNDAINRNRAYYENVIAMYKGDYLSELKDDMHIAAKSVFLRNTMLTFIEEYGEYLHKTKNYDRMEEVARIGLDISSIDESMYAMLIRSYYYRGMYEEAVSVYSRMAEQLYHLAGHAPSAEMQMLYNEIQKETHDVPADISGIEEDMADAKEGALIVEYGTFKALYRMQGRIVDRLGVASFLCLVTVDTEAETDREKRYMDKTMTRIRDAFYSGLRVGDVICRYSYNQYLIMLTMCNYENAEMVLGRVMANIRRNLNNKQIDLTMSLREVR